MKHKTILLVEDNPDDEELTLRAFKSTNISNPITVVRDGAEALDYLFATGEYAGKDIALPAMVLLDLNLPKVDGLEVLKRLRADNRTKRLPVIILTTSHEEREVIQAYENCCNSYVRKPIESEQFRDAVTQVGLYWLITNVAPPESA